LTFNLFYAMIVNDMELLRSTSYRGFSVRSMLVFALTVIMTALLWVTVVAPTTSHAADPEANWKGDSIVYDAHQYFPAAETKAGESHGLPAGTNYYIYVEQLNERPLIQKAHIIYFTPGLDPPTAKTAEYAEYNYSGTKVFSNPQEKKTITITPAGESNQTESSCSIGGIGWIICPVTIFLAEGMDNIFTFLTQFLEVQPSLLGDPTSPLYVTWNIMRTIANVAFIIVFLIIIYSQLTSIGVSNYGLKKLLPRLIVSAILVNLSFIITALAVDISNVLGYSLQDIFIQIRQSTFSMTDDTYNSWSTSTNVWSSVAAFVLSSGAIVGGGLAVIGASAGAGGALYLLLPILVGLILTVLFVLLLLAARQAIIVVLIMIAPLAFVAYLLPNTEKWFGKWRDLFMTMLVFFPAFSLVFGGSQLAGGIIVQNATNIFGIIFGLAVQVAPLVITPLLLKLSGGLLGRIAGLINDPRKGLMDRTKSWSKDRAEMHRQQSLAKTGTKNPFRKIAQNMDDRNRRVKDRTGLYTQQNDNRYHRTGEFENIEMQTMEAQDNKQLIESQAHSHYANRKLTSRTIQALDIEMRNAKATLDNVNKEVDVQFENLKVKPIEGAANHIPRHLARQALDAQMGAQQSSILASQLQSAQGLQVQDFAVTLENSEALRIQAGGVDPKGAQRALAAAFTAQAKAHNEAVSNASSILTHYNYGDDTVAEIALGRKPANVNVTINDDVIEAALGQIASGANATQILNVMTNLEINETDGNQDFRQTFSDALIKNGAKPKFAGAGIIGNIKQGIAPPPGKARIDSWVAQTINADKLSSADVLVTQDRDYLEAIRNTLQENLAADTNPINTAAMARMKKSIKLAKKNPLFAGKIGERIDVLNSIEGLLGPDVDIDDDDVDTDDNTI